MGFLSKILGGAAAEPIEAIGGVFDKLFTSDDERLSHDEVMVRLKQQPHLAQIALNTAEASHRSVFVAGWRPFIGWVCGFALAWHFILYDIASWFATVFEGPQPPALNGTETLITVVLSLLGLGGMRTFEKMAGRAK